MGMPFMSFIFVSNGFFEIDVDIMGIRIDENFMKVLPFYDNFQIILLMFFWGTDLWVLPFVFSRFVGLYWDVLEHYDLY